MDGVTVVWLIPCHFQQNHQFSCSWCGSLHSILELKGALQHNTTLLDSTPDHIPYHTTTLLLLRKHTTWHLPISVSIHCTRTRPDQTHPRYQHHLLSAEASTGCCRYIRTCTTHFPPGYGVERSEKLNIRRRWTHEPGIHQQTRERSSDAMPGRNEPRRANITMQWGVGHPSRIHSNYYQNIPDYPPPPGRQTPKLLFMDCGSQNIIAKIKSFTRESVLLLVLHCSAPVGVGGGRWIWCISINVWLTYDYKIHIRWVRSGRVPSSSSSLFSHWGMPEMYESLSSAYQIVVSPWW